MELGTNHYANEAKGLRWLKIITGGKTNSNFNRITYIFSSMLVASSNTWIGGSFSFILHLHLLQSAPITITRMNPIE